LKNLKPEKIQYGVYRYAIICVLFLWSGRALIGSIRGVDMRKHLKQQTFVKKTKTGGAPSRSMAQASRDLVRRIVLVSNGLSVSLFLRAVAWVASVYEGSVVSPVSEQDGVRPTQTTTVMYHLLDILAMVMLVYLFSTATNKIAGDRKAQRLESTRILNRQDSTLADEKESGTLGSTNALERSHMNAGPK
jgi:hypothetical protein